MPTASPCVEDETLFAFARGELGRDALLEVEAHLQGCADCRVVLAEAARSLEPASGHVADGGAAPSRIARYTVEGLLGAGAAGVVYRGFDPRLERPVALKLLRPEQHGGEPQSAQRLLREAQAMARLSDPHVVAVYDTGLHAGMVYLVMEYVDGHTLSEWLKAAPRSVPEILRVFLDAARGLAAAHRKGLVHRDFKLANVLVARDGRARVTDFGLARESETWLAQREADDQASAALHAPTRGLVGTPAYMAPELFEGGRATQASDQFAFCVALFVALFDRHPFKAGEGIALGELITRVRATTLEQPSKSDGRSERLFQVLRRGLMADPAARFADLPELMSALERAGGARRQGLRLAAAALVLAAAALVLARAFAPDSAASAALGSARVLAGGSPERAASALSASPEPFEPGAAPGAASSLPAASAAASAPATRRRAPKPGDVRYKDWLKEPF